MNRHLCGVETVFVLGDPALAHVASSLVKDVARHGGPIADLVPAGVERAVREALGVAPGAGREHPMTAGHPETGPDRTQPEGLTGILDALAAAVEGARAMPMSSSVLVNRAELLDLVDQARDVLPTQLSRADEVLAAADAARAAAQVGRRRDHRPAHAHAAELVEEHAIATPPGTGPRRSSRRPRRTPKACAATRTTTATAAWRTSRSTSTSSCTRSRRAGRGSPSGWAPTPGCDVRHGRRTRRSGGAAGAGPVPDGPRLGRRAGMP